MDEACGVHDCEPVHRRGEVRQRERDGLPSDAGAGDTLQFAAIGFRTVTRRVPEDSVPDALSNGPSTSRASSWRCPRRRSSRPGLEEIVRDIEALGYDEKEHRTSGIDALTSPITFLYEQFNRMERSKREVARLENEDRRRDLLKELLGKYVDYEIVSSTRLSSMTSSSSWTRAKPCSRP